MRTKAKYLGLRRGVLAVMLAGSAAMTVGVGTASADDLVGRAFYWPSENTRVDVPMDDPWLFRGQQNYNLAAQPVCYMYSDRDPQLFAEVTTSAPDRFGYAWWHPDQTIFFTDDTVTVDWKNITTGESGQVVRHGRNGESMVPIPGGNGVVELDIHLRSDHPLLFATGAPDLPFGHAVGTAHAVVDLTDKSC